MPHKNRFPLVMKLTAAASLVLTAVLAALYCLLRKDILLTLAITAGTTCYHFSMRLLVGLAVARIAQDKIDSESPWFRQRSFEPTLYRFLKVRRWKDKMPTYDPKSFSLRENTLRQIIRNSCAAELVHETIMICSFLPLLAALKWGALPVFLITSVLSALVDGIFTIMQRYNRPRLIKLANRQESRKD